MQSEGIGTFIFSRISFSHVNFVLRVELGVVFVF